MFYNSKQDGYVILVGVLIVGAVATSVATSVILLGVGSSKSSLIQQQGYQAQSAADACAEIAIAKLEADSNYAGETINPFGGGSCVISIAQPCPSSVCTIQATGKIGRVERKAKVTVTVGAGGGGGSGTLGGGTFPISPNTLTHTVIDNEITGSEDDHTITVKDSADPVNQPADETFQVAATNKPIIHLKATGQMLRNNRGNVGDVVNIDGDGFVEDTATTGCPVGVLQCATIRWDGVNSSPLVRCNTGGNGEFTNCAYTIPAAPYGKHQVSARDQGSTLPLPNGSPARTSLDQAFFVEPKITQTASDCVSSPKTITITGTGFGASKAITLTWENTDVPPGGATVSPTNHTTGTNGSFTALTFDLPATGTQNIGARDEDYNYASTQLENPCP